MSAVVMSETPEKEKEDSTISTTPPRAIPPKACYFTKDLSLAWLPTFDQWPPPIVLHTRFLGEIEWKPCWLLTPRTLAAVLWKFDRGMGFPSEQRDAIAYHIRKMAGIVDDMFPGKLLDAVAELEATGQPPPPFPTPDPDGAVDIHFTDAAKWKADKERFINRSASPQIT